MDKYFDSIKRNESDNFLLNKHFSSTGSSINVSPTSQSSNESFNTKKLLNDLLDEAKPESIPSVPILVTQTSVHEVKPPETPRTQSAASSYRKNLLLNQAKPAVNKEKLENLNKKSSAYLSDDLKEFIENKRNSERGVHVVKSNSQISNTKIKNVAQHTKKSNPKRGKNKNKHSIFKLLDEIDDNERDEHMAANLEEYSDDDECNDTFDIFSSQESLNETVSKAKKFDLTIDLGGLSGDDEKPAFVPSSHHIDEFNEMNPMITVTSNSVRQVKPEIIPNLMLDLMDDDKSQSVAASLAISMCKEIDYQKEMEVIYELQKQQQQQQPQIDEIIKLPQKSPPKAPIKLKALKTTKPAAMSVSISPASVRLNSPQHNRTYLSVPAPNFDSHNSGNTKTNKPQVFYLPKMKNI